MPGSRCSTSVFLQDAKGAAVRIWSFVSAILSVYLGGACIQVGQRSEADSRLQVRTVAFEAHEATGLAFDLSPDGSQIVFNLLGDIWIVPAEGGNARPVTDAVRDGAYYIDPGFSRTGRQILFRNRSTRRWLQSLDSGPPAQPIAVGGLESDGLPAWSPDAHHMALDGDQGREDRRKRDTQDGTGTRA